jgi:hypothetical protein
MKILKLLLLIVLMVALPVAADEAGKSKKKVDVEAVDVPEKILIQPTPEEIHQDAPPEQKCSSCHAPNNANAESKPLNHFLTTRDCGVCHFDKSWVPLRIYNHMNGRYHPNATPDDCQSCHISNTEFTAK